MQSLPAYSAPKYVAVGIETAVMRKLMAITRPSCPVSIKASPRKPPMTVPTARCMPEIIEGGMSSDLGVLLSASSYANACNKGMPLAHDAILSQSSFLSQSTEGNYWTGLQATTLLSIHACMCYCAREVPEDPLNPHLLRMSAPARDKIQKCT